MTNNQDNIIERKIGETGNLLKRLSEVQKEKSRKHDGQLKEQEEKLCNAIAEIEELKQKHSQLYSAVNQPELFNTQSNNQNTKLKEFLRDVKAGQGEIEVKDLTTDGSVDPRDGAYTVRADFSQRIIKKILQASPIRQFANVEQISSNSLEVLIELDEAEARWAPQGTAGGSTTTPQLEKKIIDVFKLEALPIATIEATQDPAVDLESWLINKVSEKFAKAEGEAFVNGDGINKPKGILTYPGTGSYGAIEQINSGADGALTVDSLIDIQNSLDETYQERARWLMSRALFTDILKLRGQDEYYFLNLDRDNNMSQITLLGKPVTFLADMPDPATGSLSLAYTDLQEAYTVVDRVGVNVLRDPYTSKGNVIYYTTKRLGGDVVNFDAIKLMKLSS